QDWLTQIQTSTLTYNGTLTTLQNLSYARDDEGKITTLTSAIANESWTYAYDDLHQLTNSTNGSYSQSFTYDGMGNMLTKAAGGTTQGYTYNASGPGSVRPHAVTQMGSNSYTYNANGDMTTSAGRNITYDGARRPTNINGTTFIYDGDGARV